MNKADIWGYSITKKKMKWLRLQLQLLGNIYSVAFNWVNDANFWYVKCYYLLSILIIPWSSTSSNFSTVWSTTPSSACKVRPISVLLFVSNLRCLIQNKLWFHFSDRLWLRAQFQRLLPLRLKVTHLMTCALRALTLIWLIFAHLNEKHLRHKFKRLRAKKC